MQGPVGVPEGEDSVDLATRVDGVNLVVGATVATISVAPKIRRSHAMVESGVEAALLFIGAALHAQLTEGRLPSAVGTTAGSVEVLVFGGTEVIDSALDIDAADGHLQFHLLGATGQEQNCLGRIITHSNSFDRYTAADGEMKMLVGIPCRTLTPAHDKAVFLHNFATQQHVAVTQVEHNAIHSLPERVTVVGHTAVGGEFHLFNSRNTSFEGFYAVISRLSRLVIMGKREAVVQPHGIAKLDVAHLKFVHRHEQHIAVVLAAGAAEVGV